MAATALIVLADNVSSSSPGRAREGALSSGTVTVTNGDNTGVASWRITLLDVPATSALTPAVLASASNNTPTATFTPDVSGSYRVLLEVFASAGLTGQFDKDIRNYGIRNARGIIVPPYQKLPDPLPLQGSGVTGQKPDEQNYNGSDPSRGWAGDRFDGQLEEFFVIYDNLPMKVVTSTPFSAVATEEEPAYYVNVSGAAVFNLPAADVRDGQQFRIATSDTVTSFRVIPPGGHTIDGDSSVQLYGQTSSTFIFRGGSSWQRLITMSTKKAVLYATAAPTVGTWTAGDRIFNSAGTSPPYWECVTGGTPGTWVVAPIQNATATNVAVADPSTTSLTQIYGTDVSIEPNNSLSISVNAGDNGSLSLLGNGNASFASGAGSMTLFASTFFVAYVNSVDRIAFHDDGSFYIQDNTATAILSHGGNGGPMMVGSSSAASSLDLECNDVMTLNAGSEVDLVGPIGVTATATSGDILLTAAGSFPSGSVKINANRVYRDQGNHFADLDSTFNPGTSTFWVLPYTIAISANRTYTAGTTGVATGTTGNINGLGTGDGRTMFVEIFNSVAHTVSIANGGPSGGTLITLANATSAHIELVYDTVSGDWMVSRWWPT